MFLSIFNGGKPERRDARAPHIFTITDTPRFPRALWERFRVEASRRNETTIDALRRAVERYIEQEPKP